MTTNVNDVELKISNPCKFWRFFLSYRLHRKRDSVPFGDFINGIAAAIAVYNPP